MVNNKENQHQVYRRASRIDQMAEELVYALCVTEKLLIFGIEAIVTTSVQKITKDNSIYISSIMEKETVPLC